VLTKVFRKNKGTWRQNNEEECVELYDFEVLCGDEIIATELSVPLYSPRAAWPKIRKLARSINPRACRIRVKQGGETIILVGASAALLYADFEFADAA
jgi:hypothetical protein